jgi:perosamine synthetase
MAEHIPEERIPLALPEIRDEDRAAIDEVLHSGRLAMGPWSERFERALAEAAGVAHAAAVNSGTSALHLIVRALGIGPGDEVITTPFSFIASANCALFEGATPVFADIDPESLCLDPERVEAAITPRTAAILAVDVFGRPADWPALEAIAANHDLRLIEDSAEALGSSLGGHPCGSFGDVGLFAFYPNKQITTGEGGAVVTADEDLAARCRLLANQGRTAEAGWLQHEEVGFNFRIDELSAALGASQMARLEAIVARRRELVAWYAEALGGCDALILPAEPAHASVSWFVYVVRLAAGATKADRDCVLAGLRQAGIGCRDYFAPIHLQRPYRERFGYREGAYPVCEGVASRTIALPFFHDLCREDVSRVAEVLRGLVEGVR